ncbi:MAG: diguanylate cyclase [Desulfovibrionaceae bacterium]
MQDNPDASYLDPILVERMFYAERYAWLALTQDMAAVMSVDGVFEDVNLHWEWFTGFTQSDLLDNYLMEHIHYDDRERALGEFQKLITSDIGTASFVFRFLCKNATYKRLNWNVVFSPEHNMFFCVVKDVTTPDIDTAMRYAYRDILTGLYNRLYLTDNLPGILSKAREEDCHLAIFFIDLDGFKQINDTYGHRVGDVLLKEVATRGTRILSSNDLLFRLGGDEFLAIMGNCRDKDAMGMTAQSFIDAISAPFELEGRILGVGASVGIAVFPDDTEDADDLIHMADEAMYHVKRSGKNAYAFAADVAVLRAADHA